jgi:hypothetical protein
VVGLPCRRRRSQLSPEDEPATVGRIEFLHLRHELGDAHATCHAVAAA